MLEGFTVTDQKTASWSIDWEDWIADCAGISSSFCLLVFLHVMKIWFVASQKCLVLLSLLIHNQLYKWIPGKENIPWRTKAGNFLGVILVMPYLCLKSLKKYSVEGGEGVAAAITASIQGWCVDHILKSHFSFRGSFQYIYILYYLNSILFIIYTSKTGMCLSCLSSHVRSFVQSETWFPYSCCFLVDKKVWIQMTSVSDVDAVFMSEM